MYNWAINKGVQPLTTHGSKNPNDWEAEFRKLGEPYNEVIDMLRQGRVGEGGDKNKNFSKNEMGNMSDSMTVKQGYACGTDNATPGYHMIGENGPELVKMNGGEKVIPNEVLRFQNMLSDMRMKWVHEDYDRDGRCSPEDFMWLLSQAGKYKHTDDKEYDALNSDAMEESVLKGYAGFIRNYVYNYKPEATQIDSRIDPSEEHIGPMAQDIEKVNPACIKETPEGVKTVDTARLAMMNAGAIGDLARQLDELNNKFKALGL